MASIEKIKKAVDKETTQPVSYADLIAIVPHFAARIQFKKDYIEEVGERRQLRVLVHRHEPVFGREGARWTLGRHRSRSGRVDSKLGNRDWGRVTRVVQTHGQRSERVGRFGAVFVLKTRRKVLKLSLKTPRAKDYSASLKHNEFWVRERRDQR